VRSRASSSSVAGRRARAGNAGYAATKWGTNGWSEGLRQEALHAGIRVTLIEPGGLSTDWGGSSARHATALPAYDGVREQAAEAP